MRRPQGLCLSYDTVGTVGRSQAYRASAFDLGCPARQRALDGHDGVLPVAVVILRLGFATKIDTTPFQLRDGRKEKATFLVPELTENFIIVPERKLLFCYIEKVGATSFNRFFYDLRNSQPDPHCCGMWWTNTPRRLGYSLAGVERL